MAPSAELGNWLNFCGPWPFVRLMADRSSTERLHEDGRRVARLNTLPQPLTEVLDLSRDENTAPQQLAKLIATDPVLTGRVLKVVNSPFYAPQHPVVSLGRAVAQLGLRTTGHIALAVSLEPILRASLAVPGLSFSVLWDHALRVAQACSLVARHLGRRELTESAYLAGLLHDLGLIGVFQLHGQRMKAPQGACWSTWEREQLGYDHAQLGATVCRQWHLPEAIAVAIENHHHPVSGEDCTLAALLGYCDALAETLVPSPYDDVFAPPAGTAPILPGLSSADADKLQTELSVLFS